LARNPVCYAKLSREHGFTLLEIMVVIVIIGILSALIVPGIVGQIEKARVTKAQHDIRAIESALEMYKIDNFHYPTTEQGLKALVEKPVDAKNWKPGGYVDRLEKDPWDTNYQYAFPGTHGRPFDLFSYGADGKEGGEDYDADVTNWDAK
ncbi:MAG TPA: type II secretion system major pseudopilin GspG, partial [Steroidobacteraceae bacterium]|nr:type II secretion system major pseudopilin GspG [Steroidobacteraceae bacterium]